jgi:hypothetical protein
LKTLKEKLKKLSRRRGRKRRTPLEFRKAIDQLSRDNESRRIYSKQLEEDGLQPMAFRYFGSRLADPI